jgi:hypothetical protein
MFAMHASMILLLPKPTDVISCFWFRFKEVHHQCTITSPADSTLTLPQTWLAEKVSGDGAPMAAVLVPIVPPQLLVHWSTHLARQQQAASSPHNHPGPSSEMLLDVTADDSSQSSTALGSNGNARCTAITASKQPSPSAGFSLWLCGCHRCSVDIPTQVQLSLCLLLLTGRRCAVPDFQTVCSVARLMGGASSQLAQRVMPVEIIMLAAPPRGVQSGRRDHL